MQMGLPFVAAEHSALIYTGCSAGYTCMSVMTWPTKTVVVVIVRVEVVSVVEVIVEEMHVDPEGSVRGVRSGCGAEQTPSS